MPCSVRKPRVEQPSTMDCAWPGFVFCWMVFCCIALNESEFTPLSEVMHTSTMLRLYFLGRIWTSIFIFSAIIHHSVSPSLPLFHFLADFRYYMNPWLMKILSLLPLAQRGSCARGKRGNSVSGFGNAHPLVSSARWVLPLQISWFSSIRPLNVLQDQRKQPVLFLALGGLQCECSRPLSPTDTGCDGWWQVPDALLYDLTEGACL